MLLKDVMMNSMGVFALCSLSFLQLPVVRAQEYFSIQYFATQFSATLFHPLCQHSYLRNEPDEELDWAGKYLRTVEPNG